jgi:hypothetical protein
VVPESAAGVVVPVPFVEAGSSHDAAAAAGAVGEEGWTSDQNHGVHVAGRTGALTVYGHPYMVPVAVVAVGGMGDPVEAQIAAVVDVVVGAVKPVLRTEGSPVLVLCKVVGRQPFEGC